MKRRAFIIRKADDGTLFAVPYREAAAVQSSGKYFVCARHISGSLTQLTAQIWRVPIHPKIEMIQFKIASDLGFQCGLGDTMELFF